MRVFLLNLVLLYEKYFVPVSHLHHSKKRNLNARGEEKTHFLFLRIALISQHPHLYLLLEYFSSVNVYQFSPIFRHHLCLLFLWSSSLSLSLSLSLFLSSLSFHSLH